MTLKPKQISEHGTAARYRLHIKRKEEPCNPCREAWAEYHRDYRIRKQPRNDWRR